MLKIGFIGFGRMGITHFSILNPHPSVQVVGVCDESTSMLKILNKYVNVKTYTDHHAMLRDTPLDGVIVSTPGDSHAEISKACLGRGVGVFVEKPFTLSVEESREVLSVLGNRQLPNQVGYVNRFNDVFQEVKRLLDKGVIGKIKTFTSEMQGPIVLKQSKSSWRSKRKAGGGCLYEFASHCIDLTIHFFGTPDRITGSTLRRIYSAEV
jgi:predicted dehydrogenase